MDWFTRREKHVCIFYTFIYDLLIRNQSDVHPSPLQDFGTPARRKSVLIVDRALAATSGFSETPMAKDKFGSTSDYKDGNWNAPVGDISTLDHEFRSYLQL
ncbi:hypothetical protein D9758_009229 [Tetrapyrgos nigripes]|uniref:Uncharacterized protein n=1 Tax=Tetrapyrgos nigripes TaxID=182062 RepID=A0A8H5D299_9AGAR|nr:hypothetical protein D9758_009229 [Tetrapyrgos nigripes]